MGDEIIAGVILTHCHVLASTLAYARRRKHIDVGKINANENADAGL